MDALTLQGAVDVLVRTAPAEVELDLLLTVDTTDPATRAAVAALSGDVGVVEGNAADAAATAGADFVAVVDPAKRPDIADLAALLARLQRSDDPLPFVHRLGLLVTTKARLRTIVPPEPDDGEHLLPALARRLRRSLQRDLVVPDFRPSLTPIGTTADEPSVVLPRQRRSGSRSVAVVVDGDASLNALDACLTRLRRHTPHDVDLLVVDPGGDYARSRALRSQRVAEVIAGTGTDALVRGARATTREIVVLLEAGSWVNRGWLDGLLEAFAEPGDGDSSGRVVAVGPRTSLGLGHQRQPGVVYREVDEMEAVAADVRRSGAGSSPVPALSRVCLAVRRDALFAVGGPDETFTDPELATLDLCLRLASTGRLVRADRVFVHVAELPRGTTSGRWRLGATGELALLRARHGEDADRNLPGLVTAVMIVRDEEEKIARAVESISGVVDDVVVCDTGSVDGTTTLLEALGVRTTSFTWCDDFAAARNAALTGATSAWSLLLDADETLDCEDVPAWRRWLAENPADVVFLVCRNQDSGTGGASVDNASSRLLRTEDCHWSGRIHEQMVRRDGGKTQPSGTDLARIIHDGYTLARIVDRGKVERNSALTQLELDDSERLAGTDPGRAHFERGRSQFLAGNNVAADEHFRLAIDQLPAESEMLRRMALCNRALIANDDGRYAEAAGFAEQALDEDCAYTQAAVALAVARLQLDEPGARDEARRLLAATIRAGRELDDPSIVRLVLTLRDEGLLIGEAPMLLGGLLLEAGDVDDAVELLLPLARSHATVFRGWNVLTAALRRQRDDWHDVVAEAAQDAPAALEVLLDELPTPDREALVAALARHQVEPWQVGEVDRTWRAMQPGLRRMSATAVTAAARQHEVSSPGLALRLWEYAGNDARSKVGQARCLDALGRPELAAGRLADIDPTELDTTDTVFVAAFVAGLGDLTLAAALLDLLPGSLEPSLAEPVAQLRAALIAG